MNNKNLRPGSIYLVLLLLLTGILTGCSRTTPAKAEAPLVRTQTVKSDAAGQGSVYSGEVRGRYESQLAFQVSGKVIRRNVDLGTAVKTGDALMEIDTKDVRQTVALSSAQVDAARAQLNLAESNLNRYRQLFEQSAISRAQLDQYQTAYDAAAASLEQATAQYGQGVNQLGYTTLYADKDGVISTLSAEAGQVVSAGQSIVTLVQDGQREIEVNVPENRVEEVRQAGSLQVRFWALPDMVIQGTVREIAPMADKTTRTYKVRVSLVNPPAEVKLGMTASVQLAKPGSTKAVYIPLSAVYQSGSQASVWLVKDGTAALKSIKTGVFGDNSVEVLEGLQDGDVIITAGVHRLQQGQAVRTGEGQ